MTKWNGYEFGYLLHMKKIRIRKRIDFMMHERSGYLINPNPNLISFLKRILIYKCPNLFTFYLWG